MHKLVGVLHERRLRPRALGRDDDHGAVVTMSVDAGARPIVRVTGVVLIGGGRSSFRQLVRSRGETCLGAADPSLKAGSEREDAQDKRRERRAQSPPP